MHLRILELFSGIGGMHYAFKETNAAGEVIAAMDINQIANSVYNYNHEPVKALNKNIVKLTISSLEKLRVNTILMSPPCQPHTRVGHRRDVADARSDALSHICELLPHCPSINYILMENVKGFESSQARDNYVAALEKSGYHWREFILSPTQFGIPNTRHRYYCIARKDKPFTFAGNTFWKELPKEVSVPNEREMTPNLKIFLDSETLIETEAFVPETVLSRRVWVMDIVNSDASNTMCFTKAYTHYAEGTGSVLTQLDIQEMTNLFADLKAIEDEGDMNTNGAKRQDLLKSLRLRYFTPREVARLMSFPDSFQFPPETTTRQKYRLLGNSINVVVVSELIKIMIR